MSRKKGSKNKLPPLNKTNVVAVVEREKNKILEANPYTITVKVLGKFHTTTGATLDEALTNLQVRSGKGVSVWKVEHNGMAVTKIIQPAITYRFFNTHGIVRDIIIKSFKQMFAI